ncbi:MAG TPA: DUF6599 family protein [Acidobacteriota bacterium]|nr:DUF6599 family protein [Acidobacteriota bacterium]
MRSVLVAAAVLAALSPVRAQAPACNAVAGWQQQGPARSFSAENLFEYMDGNAEGYLIYQFVGMNGITCKSGEDTIVLDISEMADPEYAFGLFTSSRDQKQPIQSIGMGGQILPRRAMFAKDKYYVELAASPDKDHSAALRAFVTVWEKSITGRNVPPDAIAWFPRENLIPDSVRLVPESVLGIRLLKRGYVGQYDFGKAFLVQEESPESASQVISKLKQRIGETTLAAIADEGFTGTDKYLNGLCVFRKGKFIGGFANLKPGRDATAEAARFASRMK